MIKSLNLAERLVNLRLYRAQLASILLHNLYYLRIVAEIIPKLATSLDFLALPLHQNAIASINLQRTSIGRI